MRALRPPDVAQFVTVPRKCLGEYLRDAPHGIPGVTSASVAKRDGGRQGREQKQHVEFVESNVKKGPNIRSSLNDWFGPEIAVRIGRLADNVVYPQARVSKIEDFVRAQTKTPLKFR